MIRIRPLSKLRSYLLPAIAAIFLAVGPMACSSSGDESLNPALEGATAGEESESGNNAGGEGATENGNAAVANANSENANAEKPEGEAATSNNPLGNELNNAIANDQSVPAEEGGGAINAEVNANVSANNPSAEPPPPEQSTPPTEAADANASNPFASTGNSAAVPANAAPSDPGAVTAAPTEAAPVPVDPSVNGASDTASTPATAEPVPSAVTAAPTGPSALPEMGSKMAYYVMRGDTLGSIAQKIYGSRKKWKALQAENGLADANKIYPGDVIYFTLDEASKAFAERYEIGNRQAYTVSKGDTLAGLAAKFYGTQGAWRALWKENPQVANPDRIRVGMVLSYRVTSKVAIKDENDNELKANANQSDESGNEVVSDNAERSESAVAIEGEFTHLTASAE